jgi:O-antigen/teichoic acid export membrane protein
MASNYLDVLRNAPAGIRTGRYWSRLSAQFHLIEPSLRRRIATGAIWSIVGAGFASGLAMAANVICARFLGATHFGELAIVLATTNLFTTLFTSGLSMTASKYVAEHRDSNPSRAGTVVGLSWVTSLAVGLLTTLIIVPLSPWLSRDILGSSGLSTALSLGALVMLFGALNGSQIGSLSGLEAFNQVAFGNLVRGIATIVFVTIGAALGGVVGALWGYIAVGAVTAFYYQTVLRRECAGKRIAISYRFGRDDVRILWRFTLPVLLTTLSFTPASWWSNVLLANKSGFSEAGVFGAVMHWQMLILFFTNAVASLGLPMLSNVRAERDPAKYKKCLAVNFLLTSAPALALAVGVAICSRFILRLYGPAFEHGVTALALISFAAVLSAINTPVGHALWSLDLTTAAVLIALLRGGVLLTAAYLLAGYGAAGLAGAYVIMGVIQTVVTVPVMMWLLRRKIAPVECAAEGALA